MFGRRAGEAARVECLLWGSKGGGCVALGKQGWWLCRRGFGCTAGVLAVLRGWVGLGGVLFVSRHNIDGWVLSVRMSACKVGGSGAQEACPLNNSEFPNNMGNPRTHAGVFPATWYRRSAGCRRCGMPPVWNACARCGISSQPRGAAATGSPNTQSWYIPRYMPFLEQFSARLLLSIVFRRHSTDYESLCLAPFTQTTKALY